MDKLFIIAGITVLVAIMLIAAGVIWTICCLADDNFWQEELERKHGLRDNE